MILVKAQIFCASQLILHFACPLKKVKTEVNTIKVEYLVQNNKSKYDWKSPPNRSWRFFFPFKRNFNAHQELCEQKLNNR